MTAAIINRDSSRFTRPYLRLELPQPLVHQRQRLPVHAFRDYGQPPTALSPSRSTWRSIASARLSLERIAWATSPTERPGATPRGLIGEAVAARKAAAELETTGDFSARGR